MKTYTIHMDTEAERDVLDQFHYIRDQEKMPLNADRWFQGFYDAVKSLTTMPERCSYARENDYFVETVRQKVYKSTRIIFFIDDDCVHVVAARHTSMRNLQDAEGLTRIDEEGTGDGE